MAGNGSGGLSGMVGALLEAHNSGALLMELSYKWSTSDHQLTISQPPTLTISMSANNQTVEWENQYVDRSASWSPYSLGWSPVLHLSWSCPHHFYSRLITSKYIRIGAIVDIHNSNPYMLWLAMTGHSGCWFLLTINPYSSSFHQHWPLLALCTRPLNAHGHLFATYGPLKRENHLYPTMLRNCCCYIIIALVVELLF